MSELKKGNINDIKYRKTLINVFVNSIYLYDDKITFIFNSGDAPVTVDTGLLDEIEDNNKHAKKFVYKQCCPTNSVLLQERFSYNTKKEKQASIF